MSKAKAVQYLDSMMENDELPEGVHVVYWKEYEDDLPTIRTEKGDRIVKHGDYIFYI
mgnify:CR=1 FL=1